mmetsp:Transcript_2727/g.7533  ORF Transcript_2727/g.7533 Transcript_2727/m.7533 type:complete len:210 (-) Transcript_2727:642-1271(-)
MLAPRVSDAEPMKALTASSVFRMSITVLNSPPACAPTESPAHPTAHGADHCADVGSRASTRPPPPCMPPTKLTLTIERRAMPCALSSSRRTMPSSGIPRKESRLCTAFLISSLKERLIGLPAHSWIEGAEKSGACTALAFVAVRYGCMGRSRSKHLPHTFCGFSWSVSCSPKNQCAWMRSLVCVPDSGCRSALLLQQRWQKIWPHCRQW